MAENERVERIRKHLPWLVPVGALGLLLFFAIPGVLRWNESPDPFASMPADFASADWPETARYAAIDPSDGEPALSRTLDEEFLDEEAMASESDQLACIIEPFQLIDIGSPVTGLLEAIHVERSDLVEKGQVLAELESGAERAATHVARQRAQMDEEILSRRASLELGEKRRDRVARLHEGKALSLDLREEVETQAEIARLELERARAEKKLASLQLDQAMALLARRTIHSPIAGVVVERLMSPGERVDEETILKIAQIDPLRVEVILPSSLFGSIEPGMPAAVVPEFPGDQVHIAKVSIVDRMVDAASGTFGVRLELPNPEHEIPGGLHCQVRFLEK